VFVIVLVGFPLFEFELELIQTHMVQKPMLRVEGEKSACVLGVLV